MEILKLNLKKEIFENVKNGQEKLYFEANPYHFSRFTTSKKNTVDDIKANAELFKQFDVVSFTCAGETIECPVKRIELNEDGSEFVLVIKGVSNCDDVVEENVAEHVPTIPELKETQVEEEVNSIIESANEVLAENENTISESEVEVEETTSVPEIPDTDNVNVENILSDFYQKPTVYCINGFRLVIDRMGKVVGAHETMPAKNEHPQSFSLEMKSFKVDELADELNKLSRNYVFIYPSGVKVNGDVVEIPVKLITRLEVLQWM